MEDLEKGEIWHIQIPMPSGVVNIVQTVEIIDVTNMTVAVKNANGLYTGFTRYMKNDIKFIERANQNEN